MLSYPRRGAWSPLPSRLTLGEFPGPECFRVTLGRKKARTPDLLGCHHPCRASPDCRRPKWSALPATPSGTDAMSSLGDHSLGFVGHVQHEEPPSPGSGTPPWSLHLHSGEDTPKCHQVAISCGIPPLHYLCFYQESARISSTAVMVVSQTQLCPPLCLATAWPRSCPMTVHTCPGCQGPGHM